MKATPRTGALRASLLAAFLSAGAAGLSAQAPPPDTLAYPFKITKADLSLWKPGTDGGSTSATLFSADLGSSTKAGKTYTPIDLSKWSITSPKIGGSFSFSTSGSIGSSASAGISGGSFSFDYPGTLRIIVPAPNTFGDTVPAVIRSEVLPGTGGDLTVITPPTPALSLNSSFGAFSAHMDGQVCFVSCSGSLSSVFGLPSLSLPGASGSLLGLADGWFTLAGEKVFPVTESVSDLQDKVQQDSVLLTRGSYSLPPASLCTNPLNGQQWCQDLKTRLNQEKGTQVAYPYLYLDNSIVPAGSSFCDSNGLPSTYEETDTATEGAIGLHIVNVTWTLSGGSLPMDRCVVARGTLGGSASSLSFDPLQKLGIDGTLEAPSFHLSTSFQNGSLVATGDNEFGDLTLSTLRLLGNAVPALRTLSNRGSQSSNFGIPDVVDASVSGSIDYDLIDLKQDFKLRQDQTLKLTPAFHIAMTLPDSATWTVLDHGDSVATGTGDAVFEPGQDLEVYLPDGTPRNVVPHVTIVPEVDDDVGFTLSGDTRYKSLFGNIKWNLSVYDDVFDDQIIDWDKTVKFGPAVNDKIPGSIFSQRISAASAQFSLDPVDGPKLDAFTLDPENPSIAVASSLANTTFTTNQHPGSVTQTIVVTNAGDVPLDTAAVLDTLDLAADTIQSADINVDPAFDGTTDPQALVAGQTLQVGDSALITLRIPADPGLHTAILHVAGTSPFTGRTVTDDTALAFGWYTLNIEPHRLERRERGILPVTLYGSDSLSVDRIDRNSLRLEGQAPRWIRRIPGHKRGFRRGHENDHERPDGPALKLYFDAHDVVAALQARIDSLVTLAAAGDSSTTGSLHVGIAPTQAFTPDQVAQALLTGGAPDALAMDQAGNHDGRLDIGDLRAALGFQPGGITTAGRHEGHGAEKQHTMPRNAVMLVLSGGLKDGTPIWAEDYAVIKGGDR